MKLNRFIIAFLIGCNLNAQSFDKVKLDSLFSLIDSEKKGMGSISISKDGKEIYKNTIGYIDFDTKIKSGSNTKYRIGSITKTFTATLIMQLVEEKKLKLETLLSDFFPDVPNAHKITVEHLLRHRSGIYNLTEDKDFRTWMMIPQTRAQMLARVIKSKPQFEPDQDAKYSNTNYLLLSYILEDLEGKTYQEVLHSKIVVPCNLKNTYYGGKINPKKNEAYSYVMNSNWQIQPETDMTVPIGAGAIVASPRDLTIFYHNLFAGKLVSKRSLLEMTTIVGHYGMGLVQFPYDYKKSLGHSGGIDGFQSMTLYVPDEQLSISYLSNGVVLSLNEILVAALDIYFDQEYELPKFSPALKLTADELNPYLGTYKNQEFPFEITIKKEDAVLIVSAKDGPTFPVVSYEKDKFKSDQAGVKIQFLLKSNEMLLQLGGKKAIFKRE